MTNPGNFLVNREVAIAGGVSEQRNPTLMRIFSFIGVSDRAGSGVQMLFDAWRELSLDPPSLSESHAPAVVSLVLPLPDRFATGSRKNGRKSRNTKLDDEMLYNFIASSEDGVSSDDESEEFGVSRRVAQKHLASMWKNDLGNSGSV